MTEMCRHKEIDSAGFCKACGARAAIMIHLKKREESEQSDRYRAVEYAKKVLADKHCGTAAMRELCQSYLQVVEDRIHLLSVVGVLRDDVMDLKRDLEQARADIKTIVAPWIGPRVTFQEWCDAVGPANEAGVGVTTADDGDSWPSRHDGWLDRGPGSGETEGE